MNKPNGQFYLKPDKESIMEFVKNLPVRKIPGIGRMTELILSQLEIFKCSDIIDKALEIHISMKPRTT